MRNNKAGSSYDSTPPSATGRDGGFALVVLLALLAVGGSFLFLRGWSTTPTNVLIEEAKATSEDLQILQAAKRYLILSSAYYDQRALPDGEGENVIGVLPCPDTFTDGIYDGQHPGFCSISGETNLTFGWFPHVYLAKAFAGTEIQANAAPAEPSGVYIDAYGEPIWYAVAQSHRFGAAGVRNSDLGDENDDLKVDGRGDVVAVLISPGAPQPLESQAAPQAADCLEPWQSYPALMQRFEKENACFGNARFSEARSDSLNETGEKTFNDVVVTITRQEFNQALEQRVLDELRTFYASQTRTSLPNLRPFVDTDPAPDPCRGIPDIDEVSIVPEWLRRDWLDQNMVLVAYGNDVSTTSGASCVDPILVRQTPVAEDGVQGPTEVSADIVLLVAGRAITALLQTRYSGIPGPQDYFEAENAALGAQSEGHRFVSAPTTDIFNDQLVALRCDTESCRAIVSALSL